MGKLTLLTPFINMNSSCELCHVAIENITVKSNKKLLLDNVSLDIHCGELTSIIGPNGAGKTTLISTVLGQIPYTGSISFFDHQGNPATNPRIGYIPQHLNFDASSPVSVIDFLMATKSRTPVFLGHSKKHTAEAIKMLSTVDCPDILYSKLGELSGGELQRVLLAAALDIKPNLLIMDEPVSGVDQIGLAMFYEKLSSLRKIHHLAVILITHELDMAKKYSDKIVLLNKKVLAEGPPQEVFSCQNFKNLFGPIAV